MELQACYSSRPKVMSERNIWLIVLPMAMSITVITVLTLTHFNVNKFIKEKVSKKE